MTGKQIAANLRKSRRKWGQSRLFKESARTYCVVGLKAREAGISNEVLVGFDISYSDYPSYIQSLTKANDWADSKQDLISTLESRKNAKRKFHVERFIAFLKANAKKYKAEAALIRRADESQV